MYLNGKDLSELCDYSFGIHSGVLKGLPEFYIKKANKQNREFTRKVNEISKIRNYMVVFTDNLRLYKQKKQFVKISDTNYIKKMMRKNDTLGLLSHYTNINFIIFTGADDLEITHEIHENIPSNVLKIYCINATGFYDRVALAPLGVNVKWGPSDKRQKLLSTQSKKNFKEPTKILYVNIDINTNLERKIILKELKNLDFVVQDEPRLDHKTFYENLSECAFVLCPAGNGLDTHRIWETIILKRVPVVPDTRFFRELLKNYAVLYVKDMAKISRQIFIDNYRLVEMAQKQNIDLLYTNKFYTKKVAGALGENNIV